MRSSLCGSAGSASLGSTIQRRLVLRLAGENDYVLAGVDADALVDAPPGRGFVGAAEVQVSVLGGSANTAEQAAVMHQLAQDMVETVPRAAAKFGLFTRNRSRTCSQVNVACAFAAEAANKNPASARAKKRGILPSWNCSGLYG